MNYISVSPISAILFVPNLSSIESIIRYNEDNDTYILNICKEDTSFVCINYIMIINQIISTFYALMYMKLEAVMINYSDMLMYENKIIFIKRIIRTKDSKYAERLLEHMICFISSYILINISDETINRIDNSGYLMEYSNAAKCHKWSKFSNLINMDFIRDKCDIITKNITDRILNDNDLLINTKGGLCLIEA